MYVFSHISLTKYITTCFRNRISETHNGTGKFTCGVNGRSCQFSNHIGSILAKTDHLIHGILRIDIESVSDTGKRTSDTVQVCHQVIGRDFCIGIQKSIKVIGEFNHS